MPVVPILSVLACLWLMINLTAITWVRFLVWMAIGVVVYFAVRQEALAGRQRRAGDGLELTQEELKATWQAERDAGWVDRGTVPTAAHPPAHGGSSPGTPTATTRAPPDGPARRLTGARTL